LVIEQAKRIEELEREVERLREALERYGGHISGCHKLWAPLPDGILMVGQLNEDEDCTCGLEQAILISAIGERRQHAPGCLAARERRKNIKRWEPFTDCNCD